MLNLGSWEGTTREEVAASWPGRVDQSDKHNWLFGSPDGESYDAVAARLSIWSEKLNDPGALIVVSHGVTGRALRGLYAGLPRTEPFALPIRRDTVFKLSNRGIEDLTAS
ncbi:MAG: histidine phosphatase family protein [Rhizomicrobium sp.]